MKYHSNLQKLVVWGFVIANYNVLFKEKTSEESTGQIRAFADFWQWDIQASHAYGYFVTRAPEEVGNMVLEFEKFFGRNKILRNDGNQIIRISPRT